MRLKLIRLKRYCIGVISFLGIFFACGEANTWRLMALQLTGVLISIVGIVYLFNTDAPAVIVNGVKIYRIKDGKK